MVPGQTVLVGRADECAALLAVLETVRNGLSAVAVLRGEAGIGKSALLETAASAADDLDVVRVVGIESEMALGFAALHQVLRRFETGIDALPDPQARALRVVFGTIDDVAPDRFLVGLAALTLLSNAAADPGVLVVIDDAQWLDEESAHVLGFVARRLYADRVGMLIAVRDSTESPVAFDGLPTVTLGALSDELADELLRLNVQGALAEHVRRRVINDAGGSPLALLEIARELSADQQAGIEPLPTPYPINRDLQARFQRRIRTLSSQAQTFLLVAAADPTGDSDLVRNAAQLLGCRADASEVEGLVHLSPRVEFRHPLVRSAIYQGASDQERRGAHEALAAATDAVRDPERRAWHRAAATLDPDEDVADELERAASRAQTLGSYAANEALLARSAELTPDVSRRATRYLLATVAAISAGKGEPARAYLARARPELADPILAAQALRLEATVDYISARDVDDLDTSTHVGRRQASMMVEAARSLMPLDLRLARETLLDAIPMAIYAGSFGSVSPREVAEMAQSMRLPPSADATPVDWLLDALADLYADGYAVAAPGLRRALDALMGDPGARSDPRCLVYGCYAAFALSDDTAARALGGECLALGRNLDAWQVVAESLAYLGMSELRTGSLDGAEQHFTELIDLEVLLGHDGGQGPASKLVVAAWRGLEHEVRAGADVMGREARQRGIGYIADLCDHALALLEVGLGNYGAAAQLTLGTLDHNVAIAPARASDAVEANVRVGDRAVAEKLVKWLEHRAHASQSSLDLGLLERCRALTSDDADAEAHYAAAIEHLGATTAERELARAHLLYGEWLRRQNRRVDARRELTDAHQMFESERAAGFEQRTRAELLASGAKARKRTDETRRDLTPQEERIARLAAQGATNPEIGTRLFISPSTVDYHLRKVYAKLEIDSRRDLVHTPYFDAVSSSQ